MKSPVICAWCGKTALKESGAINRSRAQGMFLYCGRECSGLGRRKGKTKAEKVSEKAAYDREYRSFNRLLLKQKKAAYFQATYDPAIAAVKRRDRMPYHVAYCRRPQYRAKKRIYDLNRRGQEFGEFVESYMLLSDIENEIADRASRYDIYSANGTLNKALQRKRNYETISD